VLQARHEEGPAIGPPLLGADLVPLAIGETGYVRLMRLHMGRGNRAEALRVYRRCRDTLARDLGVPPSSQTEAVHREVLAG